MRTLSVVTFFFSMALSGPAYAGVITYVEDDIHFTWQTDDALYNFRRGSLFYLSRQHPTEEFLFDYVGDSVETLLDNFVIDANSSINKIIPHSDMYFMIRDGEFSEGFITYNDRDQVMRRLPGTYNIHPQSTSRSEDPYNFRNLTQEQAGAKFYWVSKAQASSSTVPEPSTAIAMGLLGIVGFAGNRRRRRQS
ncbi:MAG: PEP-CTERM sorting domain-containing protein [Rubripirellula sp.]